MTREGHSKRWAIVTDQDQVTVGEIHRLLLDQKDTLKDIKNAQEQSNGRVTALEKDAVRIKTAWTMGVITLGFLGDSIKHKLGL